MVGVGVLLRTALLALTICNCAHQQVDTKTLVERADADPIAALSQYEGKTLLVTGTVLKKDLAKRTGTSFNVSTFGGFGSARGGTYTHTLGLSAGA